MRTVVLAAAVGIPLVLAALLPVVAPGTGVTGATTARATVQLRVHVTAAAVGVALFALACSFGIMYLLQERELKGKRFGPLLSLLPSLHALHRVNGILVAVGFGVFTVALVSGSVLARTAWCRSWDWDGQQVASLVVWLVFGAMVLARHTGHGARRQAVLSLVAFSLVITCLLSVRLVGGTKHTVFTTVAVACAGPR